MLHCGCVEEHLDADMGLANILDPILPDMGDTWQQRLAIVRPSMTINGK